MPNHPDIQIKIFTQTIAQHCIIDLVMEGTGLSRYSSKFGAPKDQKSACTTNTRNIASIRSNSIFDCLGPFVILEIIL